MVMIVMTVMVTGDDGRVDGDGVLVILVKVIYGDDASGGGNDGGCNHFHNIFMGFS